MWDDDAGEGTCVSARKWQRSVAGRCQRKARMGDGWRGSRHAWRRRLKTARAHIVLVMLPQSVEGDVGRGTFRPLERGLPEQIVNHTFQHGLKG